MGTRLIADPTAMPIVILPMETQKGLTSVITQVQGVVAAHAEFIHKPHSIKVYGRMARY